MDELDAIFRKADEMVAAAAHRGEWPEPEPAVEALCILSPITHRFLCSGDPPPAPDALWLSGLDAAYRAAVSRSVRVCPQCVTTITVALSP